MKSRSIRVALFTGFVLASASLSFAGDQTRIYRAPSQSEINRDGVPQALPQGKGGWVTRNQKTLKGNAYRSQTAAQSPAVANNSGVVYSTREDAAIRK